MDRLEARLNALGVPYEWRGAAIVPGGRVLLFSGCEVAAVGRRYRLAWFLTGRVTYVSGVDEIMRLVFCGPRGFLPPGGTG
jgi:hypothetical protein